MPKVITNLPHLTGPGVWRKFFLLSNRGQIPTLARETRDALDRVELPRDHWVVLDAAANWLRHDIPLFVLMALWFLRERQRADGSWFRRPTSGIAETGVAYRYVELATLCGEVWESDISLRRAVQWLESIQLPNGGFPTFILSDTHEVGTTARALRILVALGRSELLERLNAMANLLTQTAIPIDAGKCAWGMIDGEGLTYPMTGATALTLLALLTYPSQSNVVQLGLAWLIEAQNPDGGWAEVVGNPSKVDNTFYAIWALHLAAKQGLIESQRATALTERARDWLNSFISGRHRPTSLSDMAFALRALIRFEGAAAKPTLFWLDRLSLYMMDGLRDESDLYGETEIVAIALMEWVKAMHANGVQKVWLWTMNEGKATQLWEMPSLPPLFLRRETGLQDLLYSIAYSRLWLRIVDRLSDLAVPETVVGVLLGLFVVMGVLDDGVLRALTLENDVLRETTMNIFLFGVNLIWLLVKLTPRGRRFQRMLAYIMSLAATALFFAYYSAAISLGSSVAFARVVALYVLVTDMVGYTADKSGLARSLLKG